jgi:hypothetical protein
LFKQAYTGFAQFVPATTLQQPQQTDSLVPLLLDRLGLASTQGMLE